VKVTTPAMAAAFRILTGGHSVRTNHQRCADDRMIWGKTQRIPEWKIERIYELRDQRGWSCKQIADEIEVCKATVITYLARRK
jgi:ribosome-binding protein aMBF1 (putative translation factor)